MYILKTVRPKFLKGMQNVFLFRLFQFMKLRRGKLDINRWLPKYQLMKQRLEDAWMDLLDPLPDRDLTTEELATVKRHCQAQQIVFDDTTADERVVIWGRDPWTDPCTK